MTQTPFLPVLWRETTSQLTDEQAQLFVSSVYGARTLSSKGVLVALCIGAIMLAMGALLARRKRRERLHRVRDGDDIDESTECLRVRDGDDGGVASGQSVQVKE